MYNSTNNQALAAQHHGPFTTIAHHRIINTTKVRIETPRIRSFLTSINQASA